jgi:hypothetical protein
MFRSLRLLSLFGAAALFLAGAALANHDHYDGAKHVGKLQANTMHPMGKGYHAHTDGNAKISHMSRNGQKHVKVVASKKQHHQDGRRVSVDGQGETVSLAELQSLENAAVQLPAGDPVQLVGFTFVGFAFDLGNGFYTIFWFPVSYVVPNIQVNLVI